MNSEIKYSPISGWSVILLSLILVIGAPIAFIIFAIMTNPEFMILAIPVFLIGIVSLFGFMAIAPNNARVLLLFGKYKGTVRTSGFYWVNPFFSKKKISLRIRNFETGSTETPEITDAATGRVLQNQSRGSGKPSKVNDRDGNPIEISAVVVWRVVDTAEAMFEVDDYSHYVAVQSEAALRDLTCRYPYDSEDHEESLRGSTEKISEQLREDIQERLDKAGVEAIEARISHLAYAPEIAAAMLQRQQAQAVVAARTKIVEGAVGMVEMALEQLTRDKIVELDDERRAAMVSNLLVVLCSDSSVQPVVNTGSLYH
ncbi:MAG: SPFH domain-containing protein [Planctomycetaceae bacterium]|nr:SPFH domain-containing protein [Planctomycetaceae bacterium]